MGASIEWHVNMLSPVVFNIYIDTFEFFAKSSIDILNKKLDKCCVIRKTKTISQSVESIKFVGLLG